MFTEHLIQRIDFIIFFQSLCLFFCGGFSLSLFRRGKNLQWLWLGLASLSISFAFVLGLFTSALPDVGAFESVGLSLHLLGLFFLVLFGAQCFPVGRLRSMGYVGAGTLLILPACMAVVGGEPGFVLAARAGLGLLGVGFACAGIVRLHARNAEDFPGSFFYFLGIYLLAIGPAPALYTLYLAFAGHTPSTLDFQPAIIEIIISSALAGAWTVIFARSAAFGRERTERASRRKVLAFSFGIVAVGVAVTLGFSLTELMGDRTEGSVREELYMLVSAVGNAIDQQDVREVSVPPYSPSRVAYKRMLRQLTRIRLTNKDLRFIYLVGFDPAKRDVIILLDTESPTSDDYAPPGEVYTEAPEALRMVFTSGRASLVGPYTDRWGNWVSGFSPIKDEYGAILGVVGMDIDARKLRTAIASSRLTGIVITFLLAVIGAGVGLLIERNSELVTANAQLQREVIWRVQAESDLREARAVAERASRAKGDFLARMSHEIRTPMNSIIGMADLALDAPPVEAAGHLRVILDSARHLLDIINDVLDVSKIEAGKMELGSVAFSLTDVFDSILSIMDVQARSKGLELSFVIDPDVPTLLKGDPGRIRQIIINLVGNAVKFTDRGGVFVAATLAEPALLEKRSVLSPPGCPVLKLTVRDTGVGIPASRREAVFEGFVQESGDERTRPGGTGLGLSISRQLVELMGGAIWVEASAEGGCLFTALLVLEAADTPSLDFNPDAEGMHSVSPLPLSILLVEDNPANIAVAKAQLGKMGHTLTIAMSGDEALDILARSRFDLVLMDVQMPGRDGLETTRAIRSGLGIKDPSVPVVMLTAHATTEIKDRCMRAGADDYLTKPIDFVQLKGVLRHISMRKLAGVRRGETPPPLGRNGGAENGEKAFLCRLDKEIRQAMAGIRRSLDAESLPDSARHARSLAESLDLINDEEGANLAREMAEIADKGDLQHALRLWVLVKKAMDQALRGDRNGA